MMALCISVRFLSKKWSGWIPEANHMYSPCQRQVKKKTEHANMRVLAGLRSYTHTKT